MVHSLTPNADGFILARDARAAGRGSELAAAASSGGIRRVRCGAYVLNSDEPTDVVARSHAEVERTAYVTRVRAAAQTLRAPVFTSYSAIALLGLPIVGSWPSEVFVLAPDRHGHRRPGVIAIARLHDIEVTDAASCVAASVESSLIQLCRDAPLAAALVAVDAAICTTKSHRTPPLTTLERLWAEHELRGRYVGSRRVRAVLERARDGAESPLETISRLTMEELGFPEPILQQEFWLPELGRRAKLDFGWPEYGVGGEADGRGKYLGNGDAAASAQSVIDEKLREDALRRQLAGFARWDWSDARSRTVLGTRLQLAGLPTVRRPITLATW